MLELISLLETLVILFVPFYQPVLGIVLGLPRVLGNTEPASFLSRVGGGGRGGGEVRVAALALHTA